MSPLQGRYQFGLRTGNSAGIHKIVDIRAKINQSRGFVVGNSQRIILPHFFQSVLELMNLPLTGYQALPHAERDRQCTSAPTVGAGRRRGFRCPVEAGEPSTRKALLRNVEVGILVVLRRGAATGLVGEVDGVDLGRGPGAAMRGSGALPRDLFAVRRTRARVT